MRTTNVPLAVRVGDQHLTRAVRDLSFRKEAVGGVRAISVSISESVADATTFQPYDPVYVYDGRNGECIAEGRVSDQGRTASQEGQAWGLAAFGPANHVEDITTPYIAIDGQLSRWELATTGTSGGARVTRAEDASRVPGIKILASQGYAVGIGWMALASYRGPYYTGRTLARFDATFSTGIGIANWRMQMVATTGTGAATGTATTDVDASGSNGWGLSAVVGNSNFATSADVAHFRLARVTTTTTGNEDHWVNVGAITVQTQRVNKAGTALTAGSNYPNAWVLAHNVVEDLLGRHLPRYDGANAVVDTSSAFHINQVAYPDGTTPGRVLDDLMALEPAYRWYTYPALRGQTKYRFVWEPWPTSVRYQVSLADGASFPSAVQDLYNKVLVRYVSGEQVRTVTVTSTVAILADEGITRQAFIDLGDSVGSSEQATRVGENFLADHAVVANSGTLTVARPILDLERGTWVQPWEIEPGELVSVQGLTANTDALNATKRNGSSVFRILTMEYRASTNSARLELDSYSRTTANALARLARRDSGRYR